MKSIIKPELWDSAKINGPKLKDVAEGSNKDTLIKIKKSLELNDE